MKSIIIMGLLTIYGLRKGKTIEAKSRVLAKSLEKGNRQKINFWIISSIATVAVSAAGGIAVYLNKKKQEEEKKKAEAEGIKAEQQRKKDDFDQLVGDKRKKIKTFFDGKFVILSHDGHIFLTLGRTVEDMLANYKENFVSTVELGSILDPYTVLAMRDGNVIKRDIKKGEILAEDKLNKIGANNEFLLFEIYFVMNMQAQDNQQSSESSNGQVILNLRTEAVKKSGLTATQKKEINSYCDNVVLRYFFRENFREENKLQNIYEAYKQAYP